MEPKIRYTASYMQKIKDEITALEKEPMIDFNAHLLPKRDLGTMVEAIAISSPAGKMSNRARKAAEKRHDTALFGDWTPDIRHDPVVAKRISDLRHALRLMELVNRGTKPRKYPKEINRIIAFS